MNASDETNDKKQTDDQKGPTSPDILESLYKKNLENLNKNKTLSLLSKLYEIGILALEPKDLAAKIANTIQQDLSLELVCIYLYDEDKDILSPLATAESEKIQTILQTININFSATQIKNAKSQAFFSKAVQEKKQNMSNDLALVWGNVLDEKFIHLFVQEGHIKTIILHPLMVEDKLLGTILLSLNRGYETLSEFEKESIKSFLNIIALSLEKAYLYKDLEAANNQLRELDRQKDAVLHMVAHQFKGPVTTINFTTELLLDGTFGEISEEQKENIKTIREASQKMESQSEMVLDAAKITGGKLPIEKNPVSLNELLKEIVVEAENNAKQRKVNLDIQIPKEQIPMVLLDKKYTQLAIDNLLNNAIKYTALKKENNGVSFVAKIKKNKLFCTIKDTGIGIPKNDQEHIFKELFRASNAGKEGNGLGLHVAMGSIQSQGGVINFESEENVGTTFFVELPLEIAKIKL